MLKALRHKGTQKKIYIGLAIAVVLSFVVSGILISQDDTKTSSALATLHGRKILVQEYLNSYRAVQNQASWMYGDKLAALRGRINFKGEAWDRILLLDYAKREGIRVSDNEVVDWIMSQPAFSRDGRFDPKFYELYVERALRLNPRSFEEEVRQTLTLQKVRDAVNAKMSFSDDQLKELYRQERGEKNVLVAAVPWESFTDKVAVTDQDTAQLYTLLQDRLTTPEKIKVSYISVPQEKMEAFKTALDEKDAPVADLAKKYGLTLQQTGSFSKNEPAPGEFGSFPEALEQAFALPAGKESNWIHGGRGAVKLRVDEKQAERPMTKEEAKDELTKILQRQKALEMATARMKELKQKMQKSEDFEPVLKAENIATVPLERQRKDVYPPGLYPPDALAKAVSSLKEGQISDVFETSKGAMLAKVTKELGADDKKFSEEKEAFKKEMISEKSGEEMDKLLEKLRKELSLNLELMKDIFPSGSGD